MEQNSLPGFELPEITLTEETAGNNGSSLGTVFRESHGIEECKTTDRGEKPNKRSVWNGTVTQKLGITGEEAYKCSLCGKQLSCKRNFIFHARTHTGKKPFKCSFCSKAFTQKPNLEQHKITHTGKTPYSCSLCGKAFAQKQGLERHKTTHTGEKPYRCSLCAKAFTQKNNLVAHEKIHTGEKPYECNLCNKAFSCNRSLTSHARSHTEEKPYSCSLCSKAFTYKGNLEEHKRTHAVEKWYKCNVCCKAFVSQKYLQRHAKAHAGVNQYKCSLCSLSFSNWNILQEHKRTHNGEKLYICQVCGKLFPCQATLNTHIKVHTIKIPSQISKLAQRTEGLVKQMAFHSAEKLFNCELCHATFVSNDDLRSHFNTHCAGSNSYWCSSNALNSTEKQLASSSPWNFRTLSVCSDYVDEMKSPTVLRNSSWMDMKSCENEKQVPQQISTIRTDMEHFLVRSYGCGLCDETFEIESEFLDHSYHHYSTDAQKDTFLDLFDIRLLSYPL